MKAISGKKFCKLVEAKGWELKRIKSARIYVPVHGNVPLKIGLQRHLMKVAGIEEDEL